MKFYTSWHSVDIDYDRQDGGVGPASHNDGPTVQSSAEHIFTMKLPHKIINTKGRGLLRLLRLDLNFAKFNIESFLSEFERECLFISCHNIDASMDHGQRHENPNLSEALARNLAIGFIPSTLSKTGEEGINRFASHYSVCFKMPNVFCRLQNCYLSEVSLSLSTVEKLICKQFIRHIFAEFECVTDSLIPTHIRSNLIGMKILRVLQNNGSSTDLKVSYHFKLNIDVM